MRLRVRSLPLLSGLMIRRCRELWCRLQTRLGSCVAVAAVAAAAAPDRPLDGESPYTPGMSLKIKKKKGVPVVAQWLTNPTRNHEVAGSIPALAQWVNDPALPWAAARILRCCGSGVGQWLQLRLDP